MIWCDVMWCDMIYYMICIYIYIFACVGALASALVSCLVSRHCLGQSWPTKMGRGRERSSKIYLHACNLIYIYIHKHIICSCSTFFWISYRVIEDEVISWVLVSNSRFLPNSCVRYTALTLSTGPISLMKCWWARFWDENLASACLPSCGWWRWSGMDGYLGRFILESPPVQASGAWCA